MSSVICVLFSYNTVNVGASCIHIVESNINPLSELPLKYPIKRSRRALKWIVPGLLENFASLLTAYILPGLVQLDT